MKHGLLSDSLVLPCGSVIKNRCAKSAMSDSLGDGRGNPTDGQIALYSRWARGGAGLIIVGEVHGDPEYLEKPGNVVMRADSNQQAFRALARTGIEHDAQVWVQLGHAGALAYPPLGRPVGPSGLNLSGLVCEEISINEIAALPRLFAGTAGFAQQLGFGGVQVHAAHGFLLSQFLSPRFNQRSDAYGGSMFNRVRLVVEVIESIRETVGPEYPIAIKMNSTDGIEGGLMPEDALEMVRVLDQTSVDLIEISGGTYFPGVKRLSPHRQTGPYFIDFARHAREYTSKPLMVTGGFKTRDQAARAVSSGATDIVGLARALVLIPELPKHWIEGSSEQPEFPVFSEPPEGAVTAWYTMKLSEHVGYASSVDALTAQQSLTAYTQRDLDRVALWSARFL